jgi:hypothetical protein
VGIVENSLLPTRHYFRRFNDSVRLWLNEESTTRDVQRDILDKEAKESLLVYGIDVRDKALTTKTARAHMRAYLDAERVGEEFQTRSEQVMTDKKMQKVYVKAIETEVNQLKNN